MTFSMNEKLSKVKIQNQIFEKDKRFITGFSFHVRKKFSTERKHKNNSEPMQSLPQFSDPKP